MINVNPMQLIQLIKSGQNPQQLMLTVLEQNCGNPMMRNLLELAKNNRTGDIEQIARNMMQEKGLDFDKEFNNFRNTLRL